MCIRSSMPPRGRVCVLYYWLEAMVWLQYTATRRQRAATAGLFLTGALFIAVAARLSYANIEPSRAKAARRREVLEAFIARKGGAAAGAGGADSHPSPDPPPPPPQTLDKPQDHGLRID